MTNNIKHFLNILPGKIISLDKNHVIQESNLGKEYDGLLIFDILEEYEIAPLREQLEYSKNSKSSCEYISSTTIPFKKWYKNIIQPTFDNQSRFEGYTLYKEDITEKKLMEKNLFKTQFVYYEAFEAVGIGIWEIELKNGFFIINNSLKKIINTSSGILSVKKWKASIHPEDADEALKSYRDFISSKADKISIIKYRFKVGEKYIWLKSTGKIVKFNSSGKVTKLLGIIQNIDEQVLAKQSLKKYNEKLEKEVCERTIELESARKAADIANIAKSEFLSNISHEFFTPLNIILNSAKIVSKKIDKEHTVQKTLQNIEKSGNNLNELVQNMLYLVKLDLNTIKFKMYKTDILNLLNSVIMGAKSKYNFNVDIDTNISSLTRFVYCDSMNIKIVLLELIKNSNKYANAKNTRVLIEILNYKDNSILFKVQDNGIGVKEEELNTIFDRFFLGSNIVEQHSGKGLGLAICKEIIKKHNGNIWAENSSNKSGFTVFFKIPILGENHD